MKVGTLVKKNIAHFEDIIGIVIESQPGTLRDYVKVRWFCDYGTFWHSKKVLEVVSESR